MSAVVRIALTCFSFVPVQRWINIAGAALMGLGLVIAMSTMGNPRTAAGAISLLGVLGMALIVLTPGYGGGIALRFASTRSVLHLRPHGRLRMLLGATLAITLVAILITLPMLASRLLLQHYTGRVAPDAVPPVQMLQIAWTGTVALWIGTFILSGRPLLIVAFGFGAWLIPRLHRAVLQSFEPWLPAVPLPGPHIAFMLALAAWITFALWYAQTDLIRRTGLVDWMRIGAGTRSGNFSTFGWLHRFRRERGKPSRAAALRQLLLGSASLLPSLALGGLLTGAMLLQRHFSLRPGPDYYLVAFTLMGAPLGFSMVARSRSLWLRAGLDRAQLFSLAQRTGFATYSLLLGIGVIGFLAIAVASRPDLLAAILVFTATQIAFALCLFYLGMTLTRRWNASSVLAAIAVLLLYFVQLAVTRVSAGTPTAACAVVLLLALMLAWLLRAWAKSRWLDLDWRVAGVRA